MGDAWTRSAHSEGDHVDLAGRYDAGPYDRAPNRLMWSAAEAAHADK